LELHKNALLTVEHVAIKHFRNANGFKNLDDVHFFFVSSHSILIKNFLMSKQGSLLSVRTSPRAAQGYFVFKALEHLIHASHHGVVRNPVTEDVADHRSDIASHNFRFFTEQICFHFEIIIFLAYGCKSNWFFLLSGLLDPCSLRCTERTHCSR
jgi:hypothetical protein